MLLNKNKRLFDTVFTLSVKAPTRMFLRIRLTTQVVQLLTASIS